MDDLEFWNQEEKEAWCMENFHYSSLIDMSVDPLHKAIMDQSLEKVKDLLGKSSTDINVLNVIHETPLQSSIRMPNKEITQLILSMPNVDVNNPNCDRETALHRVARLPEKKELLFEILNYPNCNPDVENRRAETPLHLASCKEVVIGLIQKGANVNARDTQNRTPLHMHLENVEICEILLNSGASINARNDYFYTPLHQAIDMDLDDTVLFLLERGADVNTCANEKWSPLRTAYKRGASYLIKTELWMHTSPLYWFPIIDYDTSKRDEIWQTWEAMMADASEPQLVKFLYEAINILSKWPYYNPKTCPQFICDFLMQNLTRMCLPARRNVCRQLHEYFESTLYHFVTLNHESTPEDLVKKLMLLMDQGEKIELCDLQIIYLLYGDCYLLHKMLRQPMLRQNHKFLHDVPLFVHVLCDVTTDPVTLIKRSRVSHRNPLDFYSFLHLARYCTLPKAKVKECYSAYESLAQSGEHRKLRCKEIDECLEQISNSCGVPSLVEMSRNAARLYCSKKFKIDTPHALRKVLGRLEVPSIISSIMLMEFPWYPQIDDPPYIPRNLEGTLW